MKKFRASFTVLDKWAKGQWESAIRSYYHLDKIGTPQMEEGKRYHKMWAKEIRETGRLPNIFGGEKLVKPLIVEEYYRVDVNDWLSLSFIADLVTGDGQLIDFKTGTTESDVHIDTYQLPMYSIGLMLVGVETKIGKIMHYNQYTGEVDQSMVWLTEKLQKETIDWVLTYASEMYDYIQKNDLDKRFANSEVRLAGDNGEGSPGEPELRVDESYINEIIKDIL